MENNVKEKNLPSILTESNDSVKTGTSTTSPLPLMEVEVSKVPGKIGRNLPPGYVIIPGNVAGQPETFVCKVCKHSSRNVFSVNAVRNYF